jgi:hypothetical protein
MAFLVERPLIEVRAMKQPAKAESTTIITSAPKGPSQPIKRAVKPAEARTGACGLLPTTTAAVVTSAAIAFPTNK